GDGPRFADRRSGYTEPFRFGYLHGAVGKYDGGYSVGRAIPCTGDLSLRGSNPGDLAQRIARGQAAGGLGRISHGANTVANIDPFVFFDSNPDASASPWRRALIVNWFYRSDPMTTFAEWGNHITTAP